MENLIKTTEDQIAYDYYRNLLDTVLQEIRSTDCSAIVFGPLLTQGPDFQKHLALFHVKQSEFRNRGFKVFDQTPYLDVLMPGAPMRYDIKFPIFFGGILRSGLIADAFFISGWQESRGSVSEHEYCTTHGITIHYENV